MKNILCYFLFYLTILDKYLYPSLQQNLNLWQRKMVALERAEKNAPIGVGKMAERVLPKALCASTIQSQFKNRAGFIRGFPRLKTQLKLVIENILIIFLFSYIFCLFNFFVKMCVFLIYLQEMHQENHYFFLFLRKKYWMFLRYISKINYLLLFFYF